MSERAACGLDAASRRHRGHCSNRTAVAESTTSQESSG
jgi:hypothetical protein